MAELQWETPDEVVRGFSRFAREYRAGDTHEYVIRNGGLRKIGPRQFEEFFVVSRDGQYLGGASTLGEAKALAQHDSDGRRT
jgi:hypothetical protein